MNNDLQLRYDVLAELQWDPAVHAVGIGVDVKDGVVTLDGHVGSFPEKWDAEKAAQRVAGVTGVAVDLTVDIADPNARVDTEIAYTVSRSLHYLALDPNDAVKFVVEDGWIELTGELAWDFQRRAIVAVLRHVAGVKGINNYLTLGPAVSVTAVKSDIEAALKRRAMADSHGISVGVKGAEVTLSGTVGGWAERDVAQHAAWGTVGVRSVIDNTHIAA